MERTARFSVKVRLVDKHGAITGIIVLIHADDHPPPHIHVDIGTVIWLVEIESLLIIGDIKMPPGARKDIVTYIKQNKEVLLAAFAEVQRGGTPALPNF